MAAETDPLTQLRDKMNELEAHVRQRLALAHPRATPQRPTTDRPGTLQEPSESFLSRIARFFGGGR